MEETDVRAGAPVPAEARPADDLRAARRQRRRRSSSSTSSASRSAFTSRSRCARRSFDPKPILWNLLWDQESDWLAFLILLLVLVFWRNRLYGPREVREGAGRIIPSVLLVSALSLAFAIGTGQQLHDLRALRRRRRSSSRR